MEDTVNILLWHIVGLLCVVVTYLLHRDITARKEVIIHRDIVDMPCGNYTLEYLFNDQTALVIGHGDKINPRSIRYRAFLLGHRRELDPKIFKNGGNFSITLNECGHPSVLGSWKNPPPKPSIFDFSGD